MIFDVTADTPVEELVEQLRQYYNQPTPEDGEGEVTPTARRKAKNGGEAA